MFNFDKVADLHKAKDQEVLDALRKMITQDINSDPKNREQLEELYGQVWDTQELQEDFIVHSFLAPFISVTRKSDKAEGGLTFQHLPRYYFGFVEAD